MTRPGAEAGFAQPPHRALLAVIDEQRASRRKPAGARQCCANSAARPRASSAVSPPSSTIRKPPPAGSSRSTSARPFVAAELDQLLIEAFQRLRPMFENPRHLIGRQEHVVEAQHHQGRVCVGARTSRTVADQRRRQRPFGADQRARQVEAVLRQQLVEVVAGDAPWNLREAAREPVAMAVAQCRECVIEFRRDGRLRRWPARSASRCSVPRRQPRAVVEQHVERSSRLSTVLPLGGEWAPQELLPIIPPRRSGPWSRGRERRRSSWAAAALRWLAPRPAEPPPSAFRVDAPNRIQVLGEVEHQRVVAGLSGQRGAAAARQDRQLVVARQRHRGDDVALVARHHDAERHPAIVGSVGGIERAAARVEAHLAFDPAPEFCLQGGNRNLHLPRRPLTQPGTIAIFPITSLLSMMSWAWPSSLSGSTLPTTGLICPRLDEAHRVDQFALVAQMRAQVVLLLVPQQADVEMRVEAGGRAAGHDRAAPLQALHRNRPGIGAGVLEHDIGAPAAGELADFLENVLLACGGARIPRPVCCTVRACRRPRRPRSRVR